MHAGSTRYLAVKNFGRMQHYKDRRPPWIKFYVDFLFDDELSELPKEAQLLYVKLLLVAALFDNKFPASPVWISEMARMPLGPTKKGLEALTTSGHLLAAAASNVASTDALSNGASPHAPAHSREAETEAETETENQDTVVVKEIYEHWRTARGKTDARYGRLSEGRRQKIRARLREFSAVELIRAIDAVALDPWEDRSRHDDLTILFRSHEQVDKFLALRDVQQNGPLSADEKIARTLRG